MCVAPSGVDCTGCRLEVGGSRALRCSRPRCAGYIHLKCSGFPAFHLVRFEVTRASYMCEGCVAEEIGDQYDSCLTAIVGELELRAGGAGGCGDSSGVGIPDDGPSAPTVSVLDDTSGSPSESVAGGNSKPSESSSPGSGASRVEKKICRHYISGSCKYGRAGDGCEFLHPKKCNKFLTHGDKASRGCKKGKECPYFHPALCWGAARGGVCSRERCKFHHIRGTKFGEVRARDNVGERLNQDLPRPVGRVVDAQVRPTSYAQAVLSSGRTEPTPTQREVVFGESPGPLDFVSDGANRMNFVELRSQIQQMQVQLRMIMDRSQQCSPMTAGHCRCQKLAH